MTRPPAIITLTLPYLNLTLPQPYLNWIPSHYIEIFEELLMCDSEGFSQEENEEQRDEGRKVKGRKEADG